MICCPFAIFLIPILFLISCSSSTDNSVVYHGGTVGSVIKTYKQAKDIEILIGYPDRPYIEIGEIKGDGHPYWASESDIKDFIRKSAALMGADAVVVKKTSEMKFNWYGYWKENKAKAIRWTEPDVKTNKPQPPATPSGSLPVPQPIH